jgi:type IV secretion system protein VirD4
LSADRGTTGGEEMLVLLAAAVAATVGFVVWAGAALAALAAGHLMLPPVVAVGEAVVRLASSPGRPRAAWPADVAAGLPGPVLYWASTALVGAVVSAAGVAVATRGPRRRVGSLRRRPLGVDGTPWFATRRDLAPLRVRHVEPDRFVVARHGRSLLATENGRATGTRRGDRGAVALVGPSRSGKTTAAITGILGWGGPAVLSSVKADLLAATIDTRQALGQVRLYDPTSSTGRQGDGRWSPIRQASTTVAAQRAAHSLCDAAPKGGVDGGLDFWLAQAEVLLSGLLFVAHHAKRDMSAIAGWVMTQDRPGDNGTGEVQAAINELLRRADPAVAVGAEEARRAVASIWALEEKVLSSVYATAQTVVWPWSDPGVADAARKPNVTLDWLTSATNTAYLCAPIEDQRRLAPAFGGLLNELIKEIYLRVASTGRPLDPPLLIVIDEAGNTPLRSLPEYVSTLAGLGVVLVTIWQSLAQLDAAYGRQADTILTNHLTKVFFPGLSDSASLRYVTQLLGDTEIETRSTSEADRRGSGSTQLSTVRASLAPAHAVRQMRPGEALLIHATLPPAHVRTIPHYQHQRRRRRR